MKVNTYSFWFWRVSHLSSQVQRRIVSSSFNVYLRRNALGTMVTWLAGLCLFNPGVWEPAVGVCGLCKLLVIYTALSNLFLEHRHDLQMNYFATHNYFVACQTDEVVNSKPSGRRDNSMLHSCQCSVNHRSVHHLLRKVKEQPEWPRWSIRAKGFLLIGMFKNCTAVIYYGKLQDSLSLCTVFIGIPIAPTPGQQWIKTTTGHMWS